MRIAYYSDTYLPNVDGVVTSIVNSRGQLQKKGHRVFVFASGSKPEGTNDRLRKEIWQIKSSISQQEGARIQLRA